MTATFYLDGRKVKTLTQPDKAGRYAIKVSARKLRFGAHRVKVLVVYTTSSETKPTVLRMLLFRCRPPLPKFTG